MKMPKILFFIAGMVPTEKEANAIAEIGIVGVRNASMIVDTDNPEKCDAVAGDAIPKPYAEKPIIKSLAQAVNLFKDKQRAENEAGIKALAEKTKSDATAASEAASKAADKAAADAAATAEEQATAEAKAKAAAAWKANA